MQQRQPYADWASWLIDHIALFEAREHKRLRDKAIIALLGISRTSWSHYKSGTRRPHRDAVIAIADALGADRAVALEKAGYNLLSDKAPVTLDELITFVSDTKPFGADQGVILHGLKTAQTPPDREWADTIRTILRMPWPLVVRAERVAIIANQAFAMPLAKSA